MSSATIATVVKMMEVLPEEEQNLVLERLREYISEMQDEDLWDAAFKKTQKGLISAARLARKEIASGHAEPMDYGRL